MEKLTCIVCGRKFPRGQGVILSVGAKEYTFHSKSCALKFLRRVIEECQQMGIAQVMDRIANEFREELEEKAKLRKKVI